MSDERAWRFVPLNSLEWAQHVAVCVERLLRKAEDPAECARLKSLRDWHFAQLDDEKIEKGAT